MRLYPRLPHRVARQIAREVAVLPLEELERRSALGHKAQWFTPTGGNRVTEGELTELRERLRELARWRGYPASLNRNARRFFDAELAVFLHTRLDVSPAEAAHGDIWAFMGCVLLPELVRWRFPGEEAGSRYLARFSGPARGIRNLYGRTWWRAEVLRIPGSQRPYELLERLGEDELVQITERPTVAGIRSLASVMASELLAAEAPPGASRPDLLREVMKVIVRTLPVVGLDCLDEPDQRRAVQQMIARVMEQGRQLSATTAVGL